MKKHSWANACFVFIINFVGCYYFDEVLASGPFAWRFDARFMQHWPAPEEGARLAAGGGRSSPILPPPSAKYMFFGENWFFAWYQRAKGASLAAFEVRLLQNTGISKCLI